MSLVQTNLTFLPEELVELLRKNVNGIWTETRGKSITLKREIARQYKELIEKVEDEYRRNSLSKKISEFLKSLSSRRNRQAWENLSEEAKKAFTGYIEFRLKENNVQLISVGEQAPVGVKHLRGVYKSYETNLENLCRFLAEIASKGYEEFTPCAYSWMEDNFGRVGEFRLVNAPYFAQNGVIYKEHNLLWSLCRLDLLDAPEEFVNAWLHEKTGRNISCRKTRGTVELCEVYETLLAFSTAEVTEWKLNSLKRRQWRVVLGENAAVEFERAKVLGKKTFVDEDILKAIISRTNRIEFNIEKLVTEICNLKREVYNLDDINRAVSNVVYMVRTGTMVYDIEKISRLKKLNLSLNSILNAPEKSINGTEVTMNVKWRVGKTGKLSALRGGFQGLTKEAKDMIAGDKSRYINLDMKTSHMNILRSIGGLLLSTGTVRDYLGGALWDSAKEHKDLMDNLEVRAKEARLTRGNAKKLVHMIMNGAPTGIDWEQIDQGKNPFNRSVQQIAVESGLKSYMSESWNFKEIIRIAEEFADSVSQEEFSELLSHKLKENFNPKLLQDKNLIFNGVIGLEKSLINMKTNQEKLTWFVQGIEARLMYEMILEVEKLAGQLEIPLRIFSFEYDGFVLQSTSEEGFGKRDSSKLKNSLNDRLKELNKLIFWKDPSKKFNRVDKRYLRNLRISKDWKIGYHMTGNLRLEEKAFL